jgi:hypothetical protein
MGSEGYAKAGIYRPQVYSVLPILRYGASVATGAGFLDFAMEPLALLVAIRSYTRTACGS